MNQESIKAIITAVSIASLIEDKSLEKAKILMNEKYGNIYTHLPPHVSYAIVPCPGYNFEKAKEDILNYVEKQKPFKAHISDLMFDEKQSFYYVSISGKDIYRLHTETTELLNKYRDGCIREKDLNRLNEGKFNKQEEEYLKEYGYIRVFKNFESHITIGNYTVEGVNREKLEGGLRNILKDVLNKDIVIDNIEIVFHTDPGGSQSNMISIWRKVVKI